MFDDILLGQSAIDRFRNSAYDFVVEGESYRSRLKPTLDAAGPPPDAPAMKTRVHPRARTDQRSGPMTLEKFRGQIYCVGECPQTA